MIITIESPSGKRKWRIEPFDNGLCYRVFKESLNKNVKEKWIFTGSYPASLPQALEITVSKMLADPDDPVQLEFSASDVKRSVARCIKKYLSDLNVDVEGDCNGS